jgi:small-conductance mechanosensitive channel/CRP-like cAMP-binding protein
MMSGVMSGVPDWTLWGLVLLLAFPLAMVVIGELIEHRAGSYSPAYLKPLSILRNTLLPALFLSILLRRVIGYDGDHIAVKISDTFLGVVALNCAVAFMNVLVFGEGSALSKRMRIPRLLLDILRLFFVACGAAITISTVWGVNLGSLVTALGVGSVVIGLALQDTLGSLFSGIALVSARHFGVGDWIRFGNEEGPVLSMNWRSVTIRTRNGDALVLPNGVIARQPVTVIAGGQGSTSVTVEVRVPYEHAPDRICALLVEAAATTKGFHLDPAPATRVAGFEDNGIRYSLAVRSVDPSKLHAVRSELLSNLWYLAQRNGIVFPGQFNTRYAVPKEMLPQVTASHDDILRLVHASGVFPADVEDAALDKLLATARLERYREGQTLVEQGRTGDRVYLLVRGRVRAVHKAPTGADVVLHEFERGQLVMSKETLRGAPSGYTLRAGGDVEAVVLSPAEFRAFSAAQQKLAQEIEQILSAREEAAQRAIAKALPEQAQVNGSGDRVQLLKELFRA